MIHKFQQAGRYFILDTASGALLEANEIAFDLLDFIVPPIPSPVLPSGLRYSVAKHESSAVGRAYAWLYELQNQGLLFADGKKASEDGKKNEFLSLLLTDGTRVMTKETALDAVRKALKRQSEEAEGGAALNIRLEAALSPAVRETVLAVSDAVKACPEVSLTLETDGSFLCGEDETKIVGAVDSLILIWDRRRDEVLPEETKTAFRRMCDARNGNNTCLRVLFTRDDMNVTYMAQDLSQEGFACLSFVPSETGENGSFAIGEWELPTLFDEYDYLSEEIRLNGKDAPYTVASFALGSRNPDEAGESGTLVLPDGSEKKIPGERENDEADPIPDDEDPCSRCFAFSRCTRRKTGQIGCQIERKRVECALGLSLSE